MVGAKSLNNNYPIRYVNPPTILSARNIVAGDSSGKIIPWAGDFVRQKSILYFKDGEPFKSPNQAISTDLIEIKTIRNAIAHKSKDAKLKFNNIVNNKFPNLYGTMKPGEFLSKAKPGHRPIITFFDYYCEKLELACEQIAKF